jgi:hypothetical protein
MVAVWNPFTVTEAHFSDRPLPRVVKLPADNYEPNLGSSSWKSFERYTQEDIRFMYMSRIMNDPQQNKRGQHLHFQGLAVGDAVDVSTMSAWVF